MYYSKTTVVFISMFFLVRFFVVSVEAKPVQPNSARVSSTGGVGVFYNDLWSIYNNVGSLAEVTEMQAGIHFQNPYFVDQLSTRAIAAAIPFRKEGSFGIGYSYFGYHLYALQKTTIGYAKKIHKVSVGLQFHYHVRHIPEEEKGRGITVEAGTFFPLSENLVFGFSYDNVFNQSLFNETPYARIKSGLGFKYTDRSIAGIELEKESAHPFLLKIGVEHGVGEMFFLRGGYQILTSVYAFGIGFSYRFLCVDLSFVSHERLGYSPYFSAYYTKSNK